MILDILMYCMTVLSNFTSVLLQNQLFLLLLAWFVLRVISIKLDIHIIIFTEHLCTDACSE